MGYSSSADIDDKRQVIVFADQITVNKSLIKVIEVMGYETSEVKFLEIPIGRVADEWGFSYAWPLCDWQEIKNKLLLCVLVSLEKENPYFLDPIRLGILNQLRNQKVFSSLVFTSVLRNDKYLNLLDSLGIQIIDFNINNIIKTICNPSKRSADKYTSNLVNNLYKACLSQLAHKIKNGYLLYGESLGNNYDLVTTLFKNLMKDFNIIHDSEGIQLCENSLTYISENDNDKDSQHIITEWRKFYMKCEESLNTLKMDLFE